MNIELINVSKRLSINQKDVNIFSNINLNIDSEYSYVITGHSGAGKTTLMHVIGGIAKPTTGLIKIKDGSKEINPKEKNIFSFIFQDHNLINELNVEENLLLPLMIKNVEKTEAKKQIQALLSKFNLLDLLNTNITNLSGGEKQRIAISRAILAGAKFILADEPSANLDKENARLALDLLFKVHREQKIGLILISHEPEIYNKPNFQIDLKNKTINMVKRY